jgi:hypothetical protein
MGTNCIRITESGTSLVGTDLEALTGISSILSLPEGYGLSNGANTSLSGITSGSNKQHTHTSTLAFSNGFTAGSAIYTGNETSDNKFTSITKSVTVANEGSASGALPAGIKVNFFIKVNV